MKTVGIIGGLGPNTTAEFYLEIVAGFGKRKIDCSPPVVIGSVSASWQVYDDCILKNECRFLPYLLKEATRLEKAEVDFLVMPCNTLHTHIKTIRKSVKIPVLSIVESTIDYIKANGYKKIGLISTMATLENKVYEKEFVKHKIKFISPNGLKQQQLNKVIRKLVDGLFLDSDRKIIMQAIDEMKKDGADAIALACTDLQLLLPTCDDIPIFDTMKVLADATVDEMLKS